MDFFTYLDHSFDQSLHLTQAEGDYLCQHATDEELDLLSGFSPTFSEKRSLAALAQKYRNQYAALSAQEKQRLEETNRLTAEKQARSVEEGLRNLPGSLRTG